MSRSASTPRSMPLLVSALAVVLLVGVSVQAHAQGQIGFAQKAEDQERKWVDGLSRLDLQGMSLMAIVFHPDTIEIVDSRWSDRQQQSIAITSIDFGKVDLDLSSVEATVDEATNVRSMHVKLPPLTKQVKSLKVEFLVRDADGDTDDKRLKCKLDNRLPIQSGTVELYVLEGIERSFWCRDIDPATAE